MTQDTAPDAGGTAAGDAGEVRAGEKTLDFARTCHPACFACREPGRGGLGLRFRTRADGSVTARFPDPSGYQGYPGRMHGGIVAMLVDAAMTHCLFARRVRAVTARLDIRYRHPVSIERPIRVTARLLRRRKRLYVLAAEIIQEGVVRASAEGRFLEPPGGSPA